MPEYSDLADLVNQFNLTGDLTGTSTVPGINLTTDSNGNYIVTYTHFTNETDLTAASYYDVGGLEAQQIVNANDYRTDIETALEAIMNPADPYSTSFSDLARIDFQEANDNTPKTMRKVAA